MYPPQRFSHTDLNEAVAMGGLVRFATIVTLKGTDILTVHVPLTRVEGGHQPEFVGHVARGNPLYAAMADGALPARLIFQPADGYVSPRTYGEKARSGKVVPTWNYVAVHLDGVLRPEDGEGALRRILDLQTTDYEGDGADAWALDDAPSDYIETMAVAIAGFSFQPSAGRVIKKLSQNKPGDRQGITAWLENSRAPHSSIEYWMKREPD